MKQPAPKPGQMRLWTFQSVAHGADFISYFRWRTCWIGTEIYWHGLNDYSNEPNRRLKELKTIKNDFKMLPKIAGSTYEAKVAFLKDYDNSWDGEQDKWHGPLDSFSDNGWFSAAQWTHTPLDFIFLQTKGEYKTTVEELLKYSLLIYPHATILTRETADLLESYVRDGGKLIMGARTGYKDEFGRCPMQPMPGFAGKLCGVRVSDYTHLGPMDEEEYAVWDSEIIEAPVFNDILEPIEGGKVLATFKGNYYDGEPALVENQFGKGYAYYYGAGFSASTAETFLKKLSVASPYKDILELPREVELAVRKSGNETYLFILNYMSFDVKINIKKPLVDLLTNNELSNEVVLEKYGVLILVCS
jgi:beta-galactosidase